MNLLADPPIEGPPRRIGLIAGWGRYPVVVAEALQQRGIQVCCVGIKRHADGVLREICHRYQGTGLTRMAEHIRFFKRHRVQTATFAGKIHKVMFFQPDFIWNNWPDLYCVRCFFPHFVSGKRDRKDDTLLTAAVNGYSRRGIAIVPATNLIPELLVKTGHRSGARISRGEQQDINFGWQLAKEMGRLDVGQSVAVKGQAVLAVEAVEGTDECIRRAGSLCPSGGFVVVKVAKPQQDMRFDVPTVGIGTLESMHQAGARVLAIEADKTIIIDQPRVSDFAKQHGISLVAIRDGQVTEDLICQAPLTA